MTNELLRKNAVDTAKNCHGPCKICDFSLTKNICKYF